MAGQFSIGLAGRESAGELRGKDYRLKRGATREHEKTRSGWGARFENQVGIFYRYSSPVMALMILKFSTW